MLNIPQGSLTNLEVVKNVRFNRIEIYNNVELHIDNEKKNEKKRSIKDNTA